MKLADLVRLVESAQVNDQWFSTGAFTTFKKPAIEHYEIATETGTVQTLEGPVKYDVGHYIMTGPKGEKYPITPEKFKELKDDLGDGKASPKKILKQAKIADHDGTLHTSWGNLEYTTGNDVIVKHGSGDYGAVKKDIFEKTYDTSKMPK